MKEPNVVVKVKTRINAPAEKVWETLGKQFDDISIWTSFVDSSKALSPDEIPSGYNVATNAPVPARKTIVKNMARTSELIEVVTMYDDDNRELMFYGLGLPRFIAYAGDKQGVIEINENECFVVFNVTVRLKGIFKLFKGKLEKRFAENFQKIQNDLKIYSETGKINELDG